MGSLLLGLPKENKKRSYKDLFEEQFPYYLMFGMTEEQYWDKDVTLVRAFRKKYELEQRKHNETLWLQGLYIYDALRCNAPIYRAFSKATKPLPYPEKPYPTSAKDIAKDKEDQVEEAKERQKAKLFAWAERVNSKMREQNEQQSGYR